jgi:hypothetical protein
MVGDDIGCRLNSHPILHDVFLLTDGVSIRREDIRLPNGVSIKTRQRMEYPQNGNRGMIRVENTDGNLWEKYYLEIIGGVPLFCILLEVIIR